VIDHLKGIGANRISTKAQTFIEESSGMKAVQIKSYGDPLEVLEVVDVSEPGAPDANEALLGIEIATLNKHNSYSLATLWAAGRALPTIVGQRMVRASPRHRSRRR
jgi:hypothetical protein